MNRTILKTLSGVSALTLALVMTLAAGCGDSGEPSGDAVLITAAQGGTVSMNGDETAISIPANALAADTEIAISYGSLADYGALDNGLSRVLVLEPAGTALEIPASVLVDPGVTIGADQTVSVRQWMDGGWYGTQSAEVVSGGLVSTTVSYLAPLAIVVQDAPQGPIGTISGMVMHYYTEAPLEGISFDLLDGTTVVDSAVSDAAGTFSFSDVPVGSYVVRANVDPADNCYSDPTEKDAVVTEDQDTDVFFGFVPGPC